MKNRTKIISVAMVAASLAGVSAQAGTATWNGGGSDTLWHTANNWDTGEVPGTTEADAVVFAGDDTVDFNMATWAYLSTNELLRGGSTGEYRGANRFLAGDAASASTQIINFDYGDANYMRYTAGNRMTLGSGAGQTSILNISSGTVNFESNPFAIGDSAGSSGTVNLSGGGFVIGRNAINVGTDGTAAFNITGGSLITRADLNVGTLGTFHVAGTNATQIKIGNSGVDGEFNMVTGATFKVGIDAGGITPVLVDDGNNDGFGGEATFEAGSLIEPYFVGGTQIGKWTVLTTDGDIDDLGLALDNGGDTNWSFNIIDANLVEVWYGLGDSGYMPPEPPSIIYTNATCVWDGEAGDDLWDNPTNWAFASNQVLPEVGTATLELDTIVNHAVYTTAEGGRSYSRIHIGINADGRFDMLGSSYTLSASSGGNHYIGTGGNSGTLNADGGATLNYGASTVYVGNNNGSTGIVNVVNGGRVIFGRESGGVSGRIGQGGGYGEVNIVGSGSRFLTRAGIVLGESVGTGLFSVQGAGGQVGIGSEGSLDGSWTQYSGSTLQSLVSSNGLTTILVDDKENDGVGGDVSFISGSLLDVGFTGFDGENGSWDVMKFEGTLITPDIAFAPGVDTDVWSFDFVESSTNGVDTLRITAVGFVTDPTVVPNITDVSVSNTTVSLTWDSEPIVGYNVLSTPDLVNGLWTTNIAGITGMGASTTTNLTGVGTAEFYQIEAFAQ